MILLIFYLPIIYQIIKMDVFEVFYAESMEKKIKHNKNVYWKYNARHFIVGIYIFRYTRIAFSIFFLFQHLNIAHSAHLGILQPRYYLFYVPCISMHSKLPKLSFISRNNDYDVDGFNFKK